MNLPFSKAWKNDMPKHLKGKENFFVEKILASLQTIKDESYQKELLKFIKNNGLEAEWRRSKEVKPKHHTIRGDSKKKWREGVVIDYWQNFRTKQQKRFAPKTLCKAKENIEIKYKSGVPVVFIDSVRLSIVEVEELAVNDGFDCQQDFFSWFNTDFEGSLIHWTEKLYIPHTKCDCFLNCGNCKCE